MLYRLLILMSVFKSAIKIILISTSYQTNSLWRISRIRRLCCLLRSIRLFLRFWRGMILASTIRTINRWGSILRRILILLISLHRIWLERGSSRSLWEEVEGIVLPKKGGMSDIVYVFMIMRFLFYYLS